MINCLPRLTNLHTVLTTSCLLLNLPFALSDHEAITTLFLNANIVSIRTPLFVDNCIVKPTLNFIKLAANSISCKLLFLLFCSLHRPIVLYLWVLCIPGVFQYYITSTLTLRHAMYTDVLYLMCNRLRLSTDIKSLLTYLLTYSSLEHLLHPRALQKLEVNIHWNVKAPIC